MRSSSLRSVGVSRETRPPTYRTHSNPFPVEIGRVKHWSKPVKTWFNPLKPGKTR